MNRRKTCEIRSRGIFLYGLAMLALVLNWIPINAVGRPSKSGRPPFSHPEFDRDIRPILAENCFPCHGPDENKRKAKLRLDLQENAVRTLPNGEVPIVPGNLAQSKVFERISSKDADEVMPPSKTGKKLTDQQIASIGRWIREGATWQNHWSFVAPHRPALPEVKHKRWVRNPIDTFILGRLEQERLSPSHEANRAVLLRRLSLDLAGLPPSLDQVKDWSQKPDPVAAAAADLLASPHFGERMASDWMDLARYADTHGYNNDVMRGMWRWRDWVIDAFNRNLPYDRFITEQLAGDLLPSPTLDQRIATGFNRNHGINSEGGIIDEEYRVEYVVDRVRTTSIAWLGLTMECARCHDHKFDPITQKDFYRFFAFFNNVDETGEDGRFANAAPIIPAPTPRQQQTMALLSAREQNIEAQMAKLLARAERGPIDAVTLAPAPTEQIQNSNQVLSIQSLSLDPDTGELSNSIGKPFLVKGNPSIVPGPGTESALTFDGQTEYTTESLPAVDQAKGWAFSAWVRRDVDSEGTVFSTANFNVPPSAEQYGEGLQVRLTASGQVDIRVAHRWPAYSIQILTRSTLPRGEWRHVIVRSDGSMSAKGLQVLIDGVESFRDVVHDDLTTKISLNGRAVLGGSGDPEVGGFRGALARVEVVANPEPADSLACHSEQVAVQAASAASETERTTSESDLLRRAGLAAQDPVFAVAISEQKAIRAALLRIESESPSTMVMRELSKTRPTFILSRGQYDAPREAVSVGVPAFVMPFPKNAPANRLGLAAWLTDPANPLTARVVVNRLWQAVFGTGLVKTSENFGYQGETPSHPELLDWLAVEFMESGWDVKHMLNLMVTSATYRQDSGTSSKLVSIDPENRLLAHGPRERLTGEMLRDQALFVSGLLHDEVGGPPVFPYQPANLYKGIVVAADYPGTSYTESTGADLYRRSLYSFWKRTVPNPSLSTFDVPAREVCLARRPKTNTPLQALATMNDVIQLEASRKLAERMLLQAGGGINDRLNFGFQLATARKPGSSERRMLRSFLERRLTVYRKDPGAAKAFLTEGASPSDARLDPIELAAYANVASLLLNLDETVTRN
jgi:hypothetical protein